MKILRLLLFEACNRNCPGCCNKDWNLRSLPQVTDPAEYALYNQVLLTGGEPMLKPETVINTAIEIKRNSSALVYMYTAKIDKTLDVLATLQYLDGITVTLHDQSDVEPFLKLRQMMVPLDWFVYKQKSLRVNIFKGVEIPEVDLLGWTAKKDIVWLKHCPLPPDEVFKRLG